MDRKELGYAFEGPLVPHWALPERLIVHNNRTHHSAMPRVDDRTLDGVAFQYRTRDEAKNRAKLGGSSFLVGRLITNSQKLSGKRQYVPYLVSNKHVIHDGMAPVATVNRLDGAKPDIWEFDDSDWHAHPGGDDIAVACVHGYLDRQVHQISFIPEHQFLTPHYMTQALVGVGEEVLMVGRFVNHQGSHVNRPAIRFGNVSVMLEDFRFKTQSGALRTQNGFAVEMRSRTGFSGSPVAIYRTTSTVLMDVPDGAEDFWRLLGVNFGYVYDDEGENTWLNGVVPAWKISETLNSPELQRIHAEQERLFETLASPLDTGGYGFTISGHFPDDT